MLDRSFQNNRPLELWDDGRTLVGYAAVFHVEGDRATEYRPFDGLVERVRRGAFREVIKRGDEVLALVNHERTAVLARRSTGTLSLHEDEIGLRFKIDLADTTLARDAREDARHGNFGGSSIGFLADRPTMDVRVRSDGTEVRTHTNIRKLHHLGPVIEPAFDGTSVETRCIDGLKAEFDLKDKIKQQVAKVNARMAALDALMEGC